MREKSIEQRTTRKFRSRKGNVKFVSEKLDDLDPPLKKEQQENQAKCDAFLDELNAFNAKLNA